MIGAHACPRPRQPRAQHQRLVRSPSRSGSGPHSDRPSQCLTRHGGARTASLPNPHRVTRERAREQEGTARRLPSHGSRHPTRWARVRTRPARPLARIASCMRFDDANCSVCCCGIGGGRRECRRTTQGRVLLNNGLGPSGCCSNGGCLVSS